MATIIGTPGNDSLVGTIEIDLVLGLAGNDTILGLEGADSLFGSEDQDIIYGGLGDDLINGNQGNDFINGNQGDDTIYGGQDNDTLEGGRGNDLLYGDKGNDVIFGRLGNDTIFGSTGADLINGNEGNDLINGNEGNDTIYGGQDNDTIYGGQDNDLIYGDKGNDVIFGNLGNDTIYGSTDNDLINGNEGNDVINGNESNDTIYGGQGNDILRGGKGNDSIFGDKGTDTIYGDIGADTLTGNSGDPGTPDLFVVGLTGDPTNKTTGGLTIADADIITDWDLCEDQISLAGGLSFNNIVLQQGTGANASDVIVSISSSFTGNGAGEYLAVLKNINLSTIDGSSFIDSNGQIGPATAFISPTIGTAIEPITTPNGTLRSNGELTIYLLCEAKTNLPITYTVSGTATSGVDYQALSGVALVPQGSNQVTIPVVPLADNITEAPETVTVTLNASGPGFVSGVLGSPQSATVTIYDAVVTNQPIVFVTAPQPTTKEGTGPAGSFQFARTGGDLTQSLTINYTVTGTATPGNDYTPTLGGTITIPANQTVSSLIQITASTDSTIEPTETVVVSTKQDSNYVVGSQSTAAVSILEANPLVAPPAGLGPIVRYNSGGTLYGGLSYTTFTAAVAASNDNDIIVAQPGTYNEPGTVAINKPLTVRGSNAGLSPGSGSLGPQSIVNGVSGQPVFAVNTNQPVTIEGLTIQGNANDQNLIQATTSNTNLTIRQNQFTGIGPNDGGVIRADFSNSTGSVTIVDNLIRDVQTTTAGKVTSAIQAFNIGSSGTATITDNVIANLTGPGIAMDSITGQAVVINNSVSNVGENGIQLAGGNATISNNNITNAVLGPDKTPNTGDEDFNNGGIRLRNSGFNPATLLGTVNVTSNLVTNSFNGFAIRPGTPVVTIPSTVHVNQNNFIGNTNAGLLNGGSGTLDATNNWWGVATGPVVGGTGQNAITGTGAGSVTFIPFASAPF